MDIKNIVLLAVLLFTTLSFIQLLSRPKRNLPPGPIWLPIIGNLHLLRNPVHISLAHLAKTQGPIMSLRLGFKNLVVISSASIYKELLQKYDLTLVGRPIPDAYHAHECYKYSVSWLPISSFRWRTIRKIMNTNIFSVKRLDMNKCLRHQKVEELVEYCRKSSGQLVDLRQAFLRTSLNILSNAIVSRDLVDPDSGLGVGNELKNLLQEIANVAGRPNLVDAFPFAKYIDPQRVRRNMSVILGKTFEIFDAFIDERMQMNESEDMNLIDVLLASDQGFDRNDIQNMCLDLFLGGTDTTWTTLEWAMSEVLRNPEIMRKAKAELDQVIGRGKVLDESDVSRLPYLQCLVKESLRLHPTVAILMRQVDQDVEVSGYSIPANSQVIVNLWAFGRDTNTWTDPLEYKPERFLDVDDVDIKGTDFKLIPFGAGRKICPGMPLAIRLVPVILGSLLNSFDWNLPDGTGLEELDMGEKFGMMLHKAQPLKAIPNPV